MQFEESDGLAGPAVTQLAIDSENNIWVATSTGVTEISNVPVGIEEPQAGMEMSIFPNPTSDVLNISLGVTTPYITEPIKIYNSAMQLVEELSAPQSGQQSISCTLGHLNSGIYFVNYAGTNTKLAIVR